MEVWSKTPQRNIILPESPNRAVWTLVQTGFSGGSWGALGNDQMFPNRFTHSLAESNEFAELYLVPGKQ